MVKLSGFLSFLSGLGSLVLVLTPYFSVGFGGEAVHVRWWAKVAILILVLLQMAAVSLLLAS